MTTPQSYWHNGQILPIQSTQLSALDRGLTLGHGVFETLLCPTGEQPFNFPAHYARLRAGCQFWKISLPTAEELFEESIRLLNTQPTNFPTRLRLTASQGRDENVSNLTMVAYPIDPLPEQPTTITANLSPYRRNEHSVLLGQKSISYAENSAALQEAQLQGFAETIFCNTAGNLCEGSVSNLFLVKSGTLYTPPLESGCLPGTTRALILCLAKELGIPTNEATLAPSDLEAADEVFFTNAIRGIFTHEKQGEIATRLYQAWLLAVGY